MKFRGEDIEPGCWISGHEGQYAGAELARLADELCGTHIAQQWPLDEGRMLGTYGRTGSPWAGMGDPEVDLMVELMNAAEEELNRLTEGGYWIWEDGEFWLLLDD